MRPLDSNFVLKTLAACPFARRSGMRMEPAQEGVTGVLEDVPENLNAFGLVHAGAICGLMETAGGMALFQHIEPGELIVLNTVFNVRFGHPPRGELRCAARVSAAEAQALHEEVAREGRADKAMDLKCFDREGSLIAQAQATFRLMPMPEAYRSYFIG